MGTGIPPHAPTSSTYHISIVWLRRDLRLDDNAALYAACNASDLVCPVFVADPVLLRSPRIGAPLAQVFFSAVAALRRDLRERAADLAALSGDPALEIPAFAQRIGAAAIFYAEDYEPYALDRDERVERRCRSAGIALHRCTDHVYFGADEVERPDAAPYKIFTPYKHRWLQSAQSAPRPPLPSKRAARSKLLPAAEIGETSEVPEPETYGFERRALPALSEARALRTLNRFAEDGIERYGRDRDFPAKDATSHLSPHLRSGTIGIRTCVARAFESRDAAWLNELIWRDFYQMVLRRFPHVAEDAFLPAGRNIAWRRAPREFQAWCNGRTGYPIVDAAMRQLNETGWMHNRLRMIAASFLCKHLLIDWRKGERYFEQRLIDADLAQNNGGWQWCASTGTDAAPYFRIFNPVTQSKRFDPEGSFIRKFVPELRNVKDARVHEPRAPIVDHALARARALAAYGAAFSARP
jgi:deoxyribodipyrimidine photo-lyase